MSDLIYHPYYRMKAVYLHARDDIAAKMIDMMADIEVSDAGKHGLLSDLGVDIVYGE